MKDNCKKEVWDSTWGHNQCLRKAKKDGFCKQHHPETVAARVEKNAAAERARTHVSQQLSAYLFIDNCTRKEDLEKLSEHIQTRLAELD